jgi:mediator of RNA polymerase II transcription subunit 8
VEYNLRKVGDSMMSFQNVFATAHAYPLPQFPGTSQEHLLQMLLRKKLEPRAEDWLEEALQWHTAHQEGNADKGATDRLDMEQLKTLWDWARPLTNEIANGLDEEDVFRDNFTIAERQAGIENVNTGIRKNLDIYGEEDEDEDDDNSDAGAAMIGVESTSKAKRAPVLSPQQAPLPLVDLLRFMSSGATPAR